MRDACEGRAAVASRGRGGREKEPRNGLPHLRRRASAEGGEAAADRKTGREEECE